MTFRQTATNKSSWKKKLKTWTRASSSMSSSMSSLSTKSSSSSSSSTDCSPHGNNMPHDCHRHSTIRSSDSDDWKLGRLLGKGNFGHVVQARHVHSHQIVALKRFSRHALVRQQQRGRRTLELLQREIQIHARYVPIYRYMKSAHTRLFHKMSFSFDCVTRHIRLRTQCQSSQHFVLFGTLQ